MSVLQDLKKYLPKVQDALSDLKEIDSYLNEISQVGSELSKADVKQIKAASFKAASDYGKAATDYLAAMREMSRAGYENSEEITRLSLALQNAGDMTAETAGQYIAATDEAYRLGGSVTELTKALDGASHVASRHSVNMTELANGMRLAGSTAAGLGVEADEATAALGTMMTATSRGGTEAAKALKAILLNTSQVADETEGIDATGLSRYEKACEALNVKLRETRNGVLSLRDPMEVLGELADAYNRLGNADVRKQNLLEAVGGKETAVQLDALLGQWKTYEQMLGECQSGTGTMAEAAAKSASSWEGSANRLANAWVGFISSIAGSEAVIKATDALSGLLGGLTALAGKMEELPALGTALGAFLTFKNVGVSK